MTGCGSGFGEMLGCCSVALFSDSPLAELKGSTFEMRYVAGETVQMELADGEVTSVPALDTA